MADTGGRTKSGRVIKPSWRLREQEDYSSVGASRQPAGRTSAASKLTTTEPKPVLKRKRTSLDTSAQPASVGSTSSKPSPPSPPFDSSAGLTPVGPPSSTDSLLQVAPRPRDHPSIATAGPSKPRRAAASSSRLSAPKPRPVAARPPPVEGPTVRSFVDFNDGSDELGIVMSARDFLWDEDEGEEGGWISERNVKPEPGKAYRITITVQRVHPKRGRPPTKGIRRLSTQNGEEAFSNSSSSRTPSPKKAWPRSALKPAASKGKGRARINSTSTGGPVSDDGAGANPHTSDTSVDEYDAEEDARASSSSESSESVHGEPSDDEPPSEEEEEEEYSAPRSRKKGARRKSAASPKKPPAKRKRAAHRSSSEPDFAPELDNEEDDGLLRDRFGMPLVLYDEDDDYDAPDQHPPFSGGLNLGQFEIDGPPPVLEEHFLQTKWPSQSALSIPAGGDQTPAQLAADQAPVAAGEQGRQTDLASREDLMELLQHFAQNEELAQQTGRAEEANLQADSEPLASADVDLPAMENEVLAAIALAQAQMAAAGNAVPPVADDDMEGLLLVGDDGAVLDEQSAPSASPGAVAQALPAEGIVAG